MKKIFNIVIIGFLFSINIFSADLNNTIIDANKAVYRNILKNISDKNQTYDISLQKTLLEKLLNIKIDIKQKDIKKPKNLNEYKLLFINYLNNAKEIANLEQKIDEIDKKLKTIKSEISNLDTNSSNLLTYNLQYAFYLKKEKFYKAKKDILKDNQKIIKKYLADSLKEFYYDNLAINNEIKAINLKLNNLLNIIEKLKITKEQAELLNNKATLNLATKKLDIKLKEYEELTKNLLANMFLKFSQLLKSKSSDAFAIEKKIDKIAKNILSNSEINNYLSPLLLKLETKYLGQIKTITGSSKEEIKSVLLKSWQFINKPIFTINNSSISIIKLVLSLFIFILGFLIGAFYKRKISKISINSTSFTPSTKTLIANLGYYTIIIIAFFISLNTLGIKLSSLAIVAGALSVGIGFGLQNIVSNLVSGIILMFEKSIKIGDYIEIDDTIRGYVTDIRLRSTTIKTNDNIDIVIPNQSFIQNNVINWTMNDKIRRFSIPFGVAYGTNVHKVIKVIEDAILQSEYKKDIINSKEYQTQVVLTKMNDSSVDFELLVWVKGEMLNKPRRTKSKFLIIIYDTLYKNGIEIPFPQQDIHIKSIKAPLNINLKEDNEQ